jgi:hypothetical protein
MCQSELDSFNHLMSTHRLAPWPPLRTFTLSTEPSPGPDSVYGTRGGCRDYLPRRAR